MVLRVAGKEIRRVPAACSRARVNQAPLMVVFIHCRRIWSVGPEGEMKTTIRGA